MQPTQPKYTAEQWSASLPALRGMSVKTLDIARSVLVEGKEPIEVANEIGQSRQLVHAAIKRVVSVLERQTVGLVPVMVWLTPEEAELVKQMAAKHEQPKEAQPGTTKKVPSRQKKA
ncbi:TPA: TrfB-related DNA-binding protein [Pseudomonas aeruginosa]